MPSTSYAQDTMLQPGIPDELQEGTQMAADTCRTVWAAVELVWRPMAEAG